MGVVYLVRHAQASFGALDYDQLSELGQQQARVLGEALHGRLPTVDRVVTGTLRRHRETARGCLQALGRPDDVAIVEDAAWNEFDHEELLLKHEPDFADRPRIYAKIAAAADPRAEFEGLFRGAIVRWIGGTYDHEYTESWPAFRARCTRAAEALVESLGSSKTALVFTSGGPIAMIAAHHLGLPVEAAMRLPATLANCGVTKIVYGGRGVFLSSYNEHGWFEGERRGLLTYR